jgi:hypothetical protein
MGLSRKKTLYLISAAKDKINKRREIPEGEQDIQTDVNFSGESHS